MAGRAGCRQIPEGSPPSGGAGDPAEDVEINYREVSTMQLDHQLKIEQTRQLIMTPELKLAITLLQYSNLELQNYIQEELLRNPVLELCESEAAGEEEPPEEEYVEDEFPWEDYFRDLDQGPAGGAPEPGGRDWGDFPTMDSYADSPETMVEDLLGQLRLLSLPSGRHSIASYLIGNLDHNGYLRSDPDELAAAIGVSPEELGAALRIVQGLEPVGIGSRNLQECLLLQLSSLENPPPLAVEIVKRFLPATADGRYRHIANLLGCSIREVQEAVDFIRTLNPKPGSLFGGIQDTRYIVPDIHVEKVEDRYVVVVNDSLTPLLRISTYYQQLFRKGDDDKELSNYVKGNLDKALWLLRSIEQRRLTLFRVAQQIVEIQQPFLEHGIRKLKPLTLKDVAEAIGVHESTVSRATANKYMQTPRGLFPLSFFFSSGLAGEDGEDYSSHSIKSYLRELIEQESPQNPLSDQQLTDLLQAKGVTISRRTVAKYRQELSIPASYRRRRH